MRPRLDLASIKAALADPATVARALGLAEGAMRQPDGLFVRCPAHADRRPSCSLTRGPDGTLRANCFGCDFAGDVFDLVAAAHHLDRRSDFAAVARIAADLAGIEPGTDRPAPPAPAPCTPAPPAISDIAFDAIARALLHVGRLDGSQIAADVERYLERRGLLEIARAEGWGALPAPPAQRALVALLLDAAAPAEPDRAAYGAGHEPSFTRAELERCALLSPRGDAFVHPDARLLIPWRDPSGRVQTLQRRRLDGERPKYVTPRGRAPRWPYGVDRLDTLPKTTPIAFVEGALDAAALAAIAVRRRALLVVLGVQGVDGWRRDFADLARGRRAFVALDADPAGDRAECAIAQHLADAGAAPIERLTPHAKDWAEQLLDETTHAPRGEAAEAA